MSAVRWRRLGWSVVWLLSACLPPREPPSFDAERRLAELHVRAARWAEPLAELSARCEPSGLEQCFNARDDDCNGLVDEGCGVPDGPLQLLAAWSGDADVSFELQTPSGQAIKPKSSGSGFLYALDCPSDPSCYGQNRDVLIARGDEIAAGRYRVRLALLDFGTQTRWPLTVQVAIRSAAGVRQGTLQLDPSAQARELWFELERAPATP